MESENKLKTDQICGYWSREQRGGIRRGVEELDEGGQNTQDK